MTLHNNYIDNTAVGVACYHPGYTLVEKLQTIVRKFRNSSNPNVTDDKNFMRQYYDVYCLLGKPEIINFIGSAEYLSHKAARIKAKQLRQVAMEAYLAAKEIKTKYMLDDDSDDTDDSDNDEA